MDGGPGAIRTPDPQIRRLTYGLESVGFSFKPQGKEGQQDQLVTDGLQTVNTPANENPGALAGATGAKSKATSIASTEYRKRAEAATSLCLAIGNCDPEDACQIMEAALLNLGAGQPVPPLFSIMDAATDWADWASEAELKAYALASYHRMKPATRAAFLAYVRGAQ